MFIPAQPFEEEEEPTKLLTIVGKFPIHTQTEEKQKGIFRKFS